MNEDSAGSFTIDAVLLKFIAGSYDIDLLTKKYSYKVPVDLTQGEALAKN